MKGKIMKKLIYIIPLFLILFLAGCQTAQTTPHANCILKGNITETSDYSGDIKFLGEIENTGNRKADYVKITFTLRDSSNNILETPYTYVNDTDIETGEIDTFNCYTDTNSNEVNTYTYKISWSEF